MVSFSETYPHISQWVAEWGWIEIGWDGNTDNFIRALDEGGAVWMSNEDYISLEAALKVLDDALAKEIDERG